MFIEKKLVMNKLKQEQCTRNPKLGRLSITVIDNVKPLNQIKNNKRVFK